MIDFVFDNISPFAAGTFVGVVVGMLISTWTIQRVRRLVRRQSAELDEWMSLREVFIEDGHYDEELPGYVWKEDE